MHRLSYLNPRQPLLGQAACAPFELRPRTLSLLPAGYEHPVDAVVSDLLACLDDPGLPLLQWSELFAVAQSHMPGELATQLESVLGATFNCISISRV